MSDCRFDVSPVNYPDPDQCVGFALNGKLRTQFYFMRTAKTSLGARSFCWFCHVAAHLC